MPASTRDEMALDLAHVSAADVARVGVKTANLAALLQAGFPVPPGIVLTTDAQARFTGPTPSGPGGPPTLRALLSGVVAAIGPGPLAVRSSGVAEDLPDASFAGQYETVLDVLGLDELARAVRHCWESAVSPHASAYLETHGIDGHAMAVLVQEMVHPEAAGVAFSANPVNGNRREVIVDAVPGRGAALVSGETSPDQWVVGEDEVRCESAPHGAIDAGQARAIAEMARRVEEHFGSPQDIEWAITGGAPVLLQARPITALPEPPAVEPIPVEVDVPPGFWFFDGSHGNSHVPIDRFLMDLVRPCSARWCEAFGYLFDGIEFRAIGGWPYQRMIPLGDRQGPQLPTWLMWVLVRTVPALRRRVAAAVEATRSDLPGRIIERWYREWQPEMEGAIGSLRDVELQALTDPGLVRHVEEARQLMASGVEIHMLAHGAMAPILRELVQTCEDLLGWDMARAMELVRGTSFKSTEPARRLRELADLAEERPAVRRLIDDPTGDADRLTDADPEFADRLAVFLHRYGCRALGHTTLGEATLAENPGLVLAMISGQIERGYDPHRDIEDNARTRAQTLRHAETLLAERPDDLRRLRRVVERAERAYPVREDNEFFCFSSPLALLRYAVLEIGRRLAARGTLDTADDVLYLELDEAVAAIDGDGDLRPLVLRRRAEQAWIDSHPGPPSYGRPPPGPPSLDFLPADARPPMESILWSNEVIMAVDESSRDAGSPDSGLSGMAASPGTYTGPVRVVPDESQFDRIRPGDVLVCPATSPVWSVVFPGIGALVTDTGGLLSHPAIIAREYRIPAVVATGSATRLLHDGDVVTVDGTIGTVTRHPSM